MALVLETAALNAMADALADLADAGAGANATFEVTTAAAAVLAAIDLQNPAFGDATGGVATVIGLPLSAVAGATGTAANFRVKDTDGTLIYTGTVGLAGSGADAIIDSTSITVGDTVQLNSHSIQQA